MNVIALGIAIATIFIVLFDPHFIQIRCADGTYVYGIGYEYRR